MTHQQPRHLIIKLLAVYRPAATAILFCDVAALRHEAAFDAVEGGGAVGEFLVIVPRNQSPKILDRFGHNTLVQLEGHATQQLAVTRYVHINYRIQRRLLATSSAPLLLDSHLELFGLYLLLKQLIYHFGVLTVKARAQVAVICWDQKAFIH